LEVISFIKVSRTTRQIHHFHQHIFVSDTYVADFSESSMFDAYEAGE